MYWVISISNFLKDTNANENEIHIKVIHTKSGQTWLAQCNIAIGKIIEYIEFFN